MEILQRTIDEQRAAFRPSRAADEEAAAFRASRAEEEERRRSALRLRQEQDAAYLESLRKDQVLSMRGYSSVLHDTMYISCSVLRSLSYWMCQCRKKKDPRRAFIRRESQSQRQARNILDKQQEKLLPRHLRLEHLGIRELHLHIEQKQIRRYEKQLNIFGIGKLVIITIRYILVIISTKKKLCRQL